MSWIKNVDIAVFFGAQVDAKCNYDTPVKMTRQQLLKNGLLHCYKDDEDWDAYYTIKAGRLKFDSSWLWLIPVAMKVMKTKCDGDTIGRLIQVYLDSKLHNFDRREYYRICYAFINCPDKTKLLNARERFKYLKEKNMKALIQKYYAK